MSNAPVTDTAVSDTAVSDTAVSDTAISDTKAWLAGVFQAILGQPAGSMDDAADLVSDVGLDSMGLAELGARIRQERGVRIRARDLAVDRTVGALVRLIEADS